MAKAIRVAIIGAASAVFSMKLVADFCATESLAGSTVWMMDMDAQRLDAIHTVATRFASETGSPVSFVKTLDREEALTGADFVVNTALDGGHDAAKLEGQVSTKHGFFRNGPSMHSFRQFALALSIARDMERLCPDAWLLQASNEVFDISTLLTRHTRIKVIGLCHGHYGYEDIAHTLGMDLQDVVFQAPGVNHCIWMTHFHYKGENAYPLLDAWITAKSEDFWNTYKPRGVNTHMSRTAFHLYQMYGLMPIGDTPRFTGTPRYTGWWYHTDLQTEQHWYGVGSGEAWDPKGPHEPLPSKSQPELVAELAATPDARITNHFRPGKTREQHVPIMDALVNDHEAKFQVNVPNRGAIPGIDDDVVVEVPAYISARGVQPMYVGNTLPKHLLTHMILPRVLEMEQNLEAFLSQRRAMLLYRVLMDHRTQSLHQAESWMEEVLALPHNGALSDYMSR